jgi:glycosyltransferase involved in cell wall biosynthesis
MADALHLTHTDIRTDSRILKELRSLSDAGLSVRGIGVVLEEGSKASEIDFGAEVTQITLRSRGFRLLPQTLRHVCSLFELTMKMLSRSLRPKSKIVHCHDTLVLPLGVVVKILTGAKLIYDAHELESDRNGITAAQSRLTLFVERILWRFIDGFIAVSPSIEKWYHGNFGSKRSVVILNSPLFSGEHSVQSDYLRQTFSIPEDSRIFIYVGILGRGRGLELISEVFAQPGINAHVIFLGFGEMTEELKGKAALTGNIHLHEAVPHARVVPLLRSADYGLCLVENVSLSDYYCLPNKLFEYCFAGLPVLASDFPDIRAVVEEYDLGVCFDADSTGLTKVVKDLESAEKRILSSDLRPLSWQAQEEKLVHFYSRVLSGAK